MKLLLVDDEEYVIESIKRNLDLTETGVSEVYTAFSVQQAKNIMGMVDIDIVISDIVMPGGTGDQGVCTVCRCGYGKPASEFPLWQRRDDGICRGTGSESSSVQTVHQQIRFGHESGMRLYRCTLPGGDSPGGAWGACLFEYGLSVPDL